MLEQIRIENYKSIKQLAVDVGRFNVLIGENGAGKSNFLEALAVYGAVEANKFDHEFLASRGIRMVDADLMFSKFDDETKESVVCVKYSGELCSSQSVLNLNKHGAFSSIISSFSTVALHNEEYQVLYRTDNIDDVQYALDTALSEIQNLKDMLEEVKQNEISKININNINDIDLKLEGLKRRSFSVMAKAQASSKIFNVLNGVLGSASATKFILYTPENSALRNLEKEGQILPLGVNGEGLYRLLQVMQQDEPDAFKDVMECLEVFDWIELDDNDQCAVSINDAKSEMIQKIRIKDRYLISELDQRSANEGFLFVLFYAALFCSKHTPKIFAIDNIDASLNPRLCQKLTEKLVGLAKKYDKQVFVTTHNPAILDGLDLHDLEQALFVVNRNRHGHTQLKRLTVENLPKALTENQDVNRLSEAFIRGYLGGLPSNF